MKPMWMLLLVCAVACDGAATGTGDPLDDDASKSPASITDGIWVLRVDRAWDGPGGGAGFPTDPLSEADYSPVTDGPEYVVVVSDAAGKLSIGDTPMVGQITDSDDDSVTYNLVEGTFAGGRFVVWSGTPALQAELTIYGSGLPIVASERGAFIPQN